MKMFFTERTITCVFLQRHHNEKMKMKDGLHVPIGSVPHSPVNVMKACSRYFSFSFSLMNSMDIPVPFPFIFSPKIAENPTRA